MAVVATTDQCILSSALLFVRFVSTTRLCYPLPVSNPTSLDGNREHIYAPAGGIPKITGQNLKLPILDYGSLQNNK